MIYKNMAGRYHNKVQEALVKAGNELVEEKTRFKKVYKEKTIHIVHPTKKFKAPMINYNPDVVYETKVNQLFIFEIIDRESENEIITDLIQCILIKNCHAFIFIAKSDEEIDRIRDMYEIIKSILVEEKNAGEKEFPYYNVWTIESSRIKDVKKLVKDIKNYYLKGWY